MLIDEPDFIPYAPGNRVVSVVQRLHKGTAPQALTAKALVSLGCPEGSADRIQKALRFLGLITPEFELTDTSVKLRKATSDEYQPLLAEILKAAYMPIFESYDPATASGIDLDNAFKPYDPAGQRKYMVALFMALSREAGLAPAASVGPRRGRPPGGPDTKKKQPPKVGGKTEQVLGPPIPQTTQPTRTLAQGTLFHPAIDIFLSEARKIIESDGWTLEARDRLVQGFTTQLDMFLPCKRPSEK